jgi:hypothetical protein
VEEYGFVRAVVEAAWVCLNINPGSRSLTIVLALYSTALDDCEKHADTTNIACALAIRGQSLLCMEDEKDIVA